MNSVKIIVNGIEKDMYTDFGLSLKPRQRSLPSVKSLKTSIYGKSGDLDFTEALTGQPEYENRSETLEFNLTDALSNWDSKFSAVANFLHGKKAKVIFSTDNSYYFVGRLSMNTLTSSKSLGTINVNCDFEPYKYKLNETNRFFAYKGVALLDKDGNAVKLRKINDEVKDSIVYYNSKWCIAKNVGEVVFNGDENIYENPGYSTANSLCVNTQYNIIDGIAPSTPTIESIDMVNTHFEVIRRIWAREDGTGACIQTNATGNRLWIRVPRYIASTAAELKALFATSPLTVQYKLDSTSYIELSSDIQTMLSDLDITYTIDGYSLQNGIPEPLNTMPISSFGDLGAIMLVDGEIIDKLTLTNDRKRVVPIIKIDSSATIKFGSYSTTKSAGTYTITELLLNYGNNDVSVIGNGNINFNYQEGCL